MAVVFPAFSTVCFQLSPDSCSSVFSLRRFTEDVKVATKKGRLCFLSPFFFNEIMLRQRLDRFYRHYNPACLDSIDAILALYHGREDDIFKVLEEKYGPEPVQDDAGSHGFPPEDTQSCFANVRRKPAVSAQPPTALSAAEGLPKGDTLEPHARDLIQRLSEALKQKTEETGALLSRVRQLEAELEAEKQRSQCGSAKKREDPTRALEERVLRAEKLCMTYKADFDAAQEEIRRFRHGCSLAQLEIGRLREKASALELSVREMRKSVLEYDKQEIVLLQEVARLQLLASPAVSRNVFSSIANDCQERFRLHYEKRVSEMTKEVERYFAFTKRQVEDRDALIEYLQKCAI